MFLIHTTVAKHEFNNLFQSLPQLRLYYVLLLWILIRNFLSGDDSPYYSMRIGVMILLFICVYIQPTTQLRQRTAKNNSITYCGNVYVCRENYIYLPSLGKFRVVDMFSYFKELYSHSFHSSHKVNKTNEGYNGEYNCVF